MDKLSKKPVIITMIVALISIVSVILYDWPDYHPIVVEAHSGKILVGTALSRREFNKIEHLTTDEILNLSTDDPDINYGLSTFYVGDVSEFEKGDRVKIWAQDHVTLSLPEQRWADRVEKSKWIW